MRCPLHFTSLHLTALDPPPAVLAACSLWFVSAVASDGRPTQRWGGDGDQSADCSSAQRRDSSSGVAVTQPLPLFPLHCTALHCVPHSPPLASPTPPIDRLAAGTRTPNQRRSIDWPVGSFGFAFCFFFELDLSRRCGKRSRGETATKQNETMSTMARQPQARCIRNQMKQVKKNCVCHVAAARSDEGECGAAGWGCGGPAQRSRLRCWCSPRCHRQRARNSSDTRSHSLSAALPDRALGSIHTTKRAEEDADEAKK